MSLLSTVRSRLIQVDSQPTLSACTPNTDVAAGGVALTDIAGTGFEVGVTAFIVDVNGVINPITTLVRVSAIKLTGVAPAGAIGTGYVMIRNPDGAPATVPFIYT